MGSGLYWMWLGHRVFSNLRLRVVQPWQISGRFSIRIKYHPLRVRVHSTELYYYILVIKSYTFRDLCVYTCVCNSYIYIFFNAIVSIKYYTCVFIDFYTFAGRLVTVSEINVILYTPIGISKGSCLVVNVKVYRRDNSARVDEQI